MPVCDFLLVINSNLGPILHHLATIHLWQMDDRLVGRWTTITTKGWLLSLQFRGHHENATFA